MVKKQVTIEVLAGMIKRGFDETAKKDDVDRQFGEVNERLNKVEGRLVNIESDVSYLKSRVEEIGRVLERHEELLEEYSEELKWLHKKIDEMTNSQGDKRLITYKEFLALGNRVTALEKKVAARIK